MVIVHGIGEATVGRQQQTHPQEEIGLHAVGFPVKEVAPAAHALTDQETQRHQIQQRRQFDTVE